MPISKRILYPTKYQLVALDGEAVSVRFKCNEMFVGIMEMEKNYLYISNPQTDEFLVMDYGNILLMNITQRRLYLRKP